MERMICFIINLELIKKEIEDIEDMRNYENHMDRLMDCWYQDPTRLRWKKQRY